MKKLLVKIFTLRMLLHVLFWVVAIGFYTLFFGRQNNNYSLIIFFVALLMPVTIATTYFTNYFLIPRYLLKHRFKVFLLYLIYTINLAVYLEMLIVVITFIIVADYKANKMEGATMDIVFIIAASFLIVFSAVGIKLGFVWLEVQKENQQLVIDKIESELKFLKAQIHPHFLFNTLNNLYCLTIDKSEKAPEVVLKLSGLLNYMLYECSPKFISLEKEVRQLKNYIGLESLRYSDRLRVELCTSGDIARSRIAPLLLITLLENSFKHGVMNATGNCWIKISIIALKNTIEIEVKNSIPNNASSCSKGIGLDNLRNQLKLLYNENHKMTLLEMQDEFVINVFINTQIDRPYAVQMPGS